MLAAGFRCSPTTHCERGRSTWSAGSRSSRAAIYALSSRPFVLRPRSSGASASGSRPPVAEGWRQPRPDPRLAYLSCGHVPMLEAPRQLADSMLSFLDEELVDE